MIHSLPTLDTVHGVLSELTRSSPLDGGLPAFLFRGERENYPNTFSSLDRNCRQYGLLSPVYAQLEDIVNYAESHGISGWQLHPREAAAFCQHYGLPTQMFDFTASADVAAFFSANHGYHRNKVKTGRMGILDVRKAVANACALFDLRQFELANRPRKQHGFGMMRAYFGVDDILDLKDPDLAASIGLQWMEFAHLADDEAFLHVIGAGDDLLSIQEDTAARLPQDLVDQYVSDEVVLIDEVARILSEEIPPTNRTAHENRRRWSGHA